MSNVINAIELKLENEERLIIYTSRKQYDHEKFDVKSIATDASYIESTTCPINWARSNIVHLVHVNKEGHIDPDPHGAFSLISSMRIDSEIPNDPMERDTYFEILTRDLLTREKIIKTFLKGIEDGNHPEILKRQWIEIVSERTTLATLFKYVSDEGSFFGFEKIGDGYKITWISDYNVVVLTGLPKETIEVMEEINKEKLFY